MEGHWRRVNTPLRRLTSRERNVALSAVAITVIAILALVLATAGDSRPDPAPGCIYAIVPGAMGAQPIDACGTRARLTCQKRAGLTDPGSRVVQESCRRAGLP
jgi:hypothetical protein